MNPTQEIMLVSSSNVSPEGEAPVREAFTTPVEILLIVWFTAPLCFMFVAWIVFLIQHLFGYRSTSSAPASSSAQPSVQPLESPCSSCRFFSHNAYLKCAVHPSIALTQRALNCSNFWAMDDDKFAR